MNDVRLLSAALRAYDAAGSTAALDGYSTAALCRV